MSESETTLDQIYNKNTKLRQSKSGYRFNSDSMVLSWFINKILSNKEIVSSLEIGSGSGVVPIVLKRRGFSSRIDCLEIQKELFSLLKENVVFNNLEESLFPICADFRDFALEKRKKYDLIFTNPPYFGINDGMINANGEKAAAKHELFGNIGDFFALSTKILKKNGRFVLIFPMARLQFLLFSAAQNGFKLKEILFFRENSLVKPVSFAADFIFNETLASLRSDSSIISIRDESGDYSEIGREIMYDKSDCQPRT